ncbi:helix-turn-helix transcriptional regulator [Chryseobacterium tongliaoense]|uniref:helix-turn-helix transcriptional regulator n=1 Tax=Chryseobacterium tongliaoense TaxID=3240933 RepID=UPI0035181B0F
MKFVLSKLFICISMAVGISFFAQSVHTDSLQSAINNPNLPEKNKPELLNRLAEAYRIDRDYTAAENKAKQSARIALRYKNYTEATKAYTLLTVIKANNQQLSALKQTSDSALVLAQQAKNPAAMAYGYYAQAFLYKTLDDPEKRIKFCQLGLKEQEKSPDPYIAAKLYYQLYAAHSDWNNIKQVNSYARKATQNALKTKDYNLLSNCYAALSVAHEYNYNASQEKKELDSVLFYLQKAETLYLKYPKQVAKYTHAITCINIANVYLKYFPDTDKTAESKAVYYAQSAGNILKNVPNTQEVTASSLGILSEYASRKGNTALAETYLLEAYNLMKTGEHPYYYTLINVVESLSRFYKGQGDFKKALEFQEEVTQYSNKNFNQKQALNAQKLEIQFETEKKNNEVRILKEREASRKLQSYLYACIAIASLLGLLFMFRSYHFKLRLSLQREKQLELEKQESEMQIRLEKEEQARLKAEQQLLEAQQQQLQKEAMANVLQLEHKNRMLHTIKDKLADDNSLNMQKIVREEMVLDNDFEDAKLRIQQIHPEFFNLINEKAQKKLTLLDMKLCAYLYLKMDTRQISQLMHIEPKSVRMSRYRIKQKLGLDKDEDLNLFLQKLGS